jgi:large subunit ribosomal protein L16
MLMPAKTKFRKMMNRQMRGNAERGSKLNFGSFGLQAIERGMLTARQIEAGRRALTREIRRRGKIWICVFPDKPITRRPAEVRMGGGKGAVDHWSAVIKPGRVLFEMDGVEEEVALKALKLASYKLAVRTTVLKRGV